MIYNDYANAFMVLVTQGFLGTYVMLLTEFREPVRVWRLRWIAVMVLVVGINISLILFCNFWNVYTRVGILTMTLPYTLITLWCSRYKGVRVVFNICTCLWLGCIGNANGILAHTLMPYNPWIHAFMRGISYLVLYLVVRKFQPYYRQMLQLLNRGWSILCLIPFITFLVTLYMINHLLPKNPLPVAIVIYSVTAICTCAYILIYLFFVKVLQEHDLKNRNDLLSVQILSMERQAGMNREAEEAMRIQRHDMRHKLRTISIMIQKDEQEEALKYIADQEVMLDHIKATRYCNNPVIDAVLSYCCQKAEESKIRMELAVSLSENITVSTAELSIVFANLLENAINACKKLPQEQRKIRCKCICKPQLMLQISNPYVGKIHFDSEGKPVASEEGHGIGTRSVTAFCDKYNAYCEYNTDNGWFTFRIALP